MSSHQSFQAVALTITISLGSLARKCAPANTVDYLLLLVPFTEVSHLQNQAIPPHTIPPDNPTALLPCTGQCLQGAQALNSPEQCFLQPSAISHQLQFPSTTTATARTSPWDHWDVGAQHFFNFTTSKGQLYGHTMGSVGPVSTDLPNHCNWSSSSTTACQSSTACNLVTSVLPAAHLQPRATFSH